MPKDKQKKHVKGQTYIFDSRDGGRGQKIQNKNLLPGWQI